MSIKAWGVFELKDANISLQEQIDLSFYILLNAINNKLGVKFGGNIEDYILNSVKEKDNKMVFELTDDPLDMNAECLFIGDGVKLKVYENRIDIGESLISRMSRVGNFFRQVLKMSSIVKIELNINVQEGDEFEIIHIKMDDFVNVISKLYMDRNNMVPTVKLIIT